MFSTGDFVSLAVLFNRLKHVRRRSEQPVKTYPMLTWLGVGVVGPVFLAGCLMLMLGMWLLSASTRLSRRWDAWTRRPMRHKRQPGEPCHCAICDYRRDSA